MTTQQVARFFEDNPKASISEAAAHFGVSNSTINIRLSRGEGGRVLRLTDFDVSVFKAVIGYLEEHGWPPSVTDIAEAVPCARSAAHNSLHRLAAYGVLEVGDGARQVRVVGAAINMQGVPDDPR